MWHVANFATPMWQKLEKTCKNSISKNHNHVSSQIEIQNSKIICLVDANHLSSENRSQRNAFSSYDCQLALNNSFAFLKKTEMHRQEKMKKAEDALQEKLKNCTTHTWHKNIDFQTAARSKEAR